MPVLPCALTLAGLVSVAAPACGDGAVGADYRGERLGILTGIASLGERGPGVFFPDNTDWRLRASIMWVARDGETRVDDHVVLIVDPERRFALELYTRPPEHLARAAEVGSFVLGQILFWADLDVDGHRDEGDAIVGRPSTLVGWTSHGASGGVVDGELAAGLHLLQPTASCDTERVRVQPLGERDPVKVTLELPPPASFFGSDCEAEPSP